MNVQKERCGNCGLEVTSTHQIEEWGDHANCLQVLALALRRTELRLQILEQKVGDLADIHRNLPVGR